MGRWIQIETHFPIQKYRLTLARHPKKPRNEICVEKKVEESEKLLTLFLYARLFSLRKRYYNLNFNHSTNRVSIESRDIGIFTKKYFFQNYYYYLSFWQRFFESIFMHFYDSPSLNIKNLGLRPKLNFCVSVPQKCHTCHHGCHLYFWLKMQRTS